MPIKVIEQRLLRGPNLYSSRSALYLHVDLQELHDRPSTAVPGFTDRLVQLLPGLADHRCSRGYRGGFVARLREGTYMAHILEHVIIELQCMAGTEVGFGRAREMRGEPAGHYRIVTSYLLERVVTEAVPVAVRIVETLFRGEVPEIGRDLEELRYWARRHALGPSTAAIVEAARRRGIPAFRVTDDASLFQLGTGRWQRRIQAALTSETSHIAVEIASDKDLTNALLREAGLPVPRGEAVTRLEDARRLLRRLGRVAVKPHYGNQGKGVTVGVTTPEALEAAFRLAREHGRSVLVEQSVEGRDHRVLVVGNRVVAVARRDPAHVVGDGVRAIRELCEEANRDPRRGTGHLKPLTKLKLDANALEVLASQSLGPDDVPASGRIVWLRTNANLSTGGTAVDLTDEIHPENALMAVRAARKVGLDVAGIDMVVRDISRPLYEQDGAIIEVNAAPGIRMHQSPSEGEPHDVGAAIVEMLFPSGRPTQVPIISVTGTNGKTTTTLLVAHVLRHAGRRTGTTTTEGIYLDGRRIQRGDCTGYWSARTVLSDPTVEVAVLETARGGLFKRGLAFDWCDTGIVLNVRDDHLGQHGVNTLEDLAAIKGIVARRTRGHLVLNAQDAHCVRMADELEPGTKVTWFSMDDDVPLVRAHMAQGGVAVTLRKGMVMVAYGEHRLPLVEVERLPVTLRGKARHNIENVLAAVAALIHQGLSHEQIVEGLVGFHSTFETNPGRLNLVRVRDFTVLVDYAHNPDSYRAIIDTVRQLDAARLIGVITAPGDRLPEKLREVGELAAAGFDWLVVRDMSDLRGTAPGYVASVIADGVRAAGFPEERLTVIADETASIKHALAMAEAGDLVVIGCADTQEALEAVFREAEDAGRGQAWSVSLGTGPLHP
ncbi:MAG: cyanophycin synthetase [Candidatus Sericytochromatia bacterium]|nr:cyanophycin synthetase [Candidatus Sericytochromatia bacterium]